MPDQRQTFAPHPEVVDTELDDQEIALLHLQSKTYYSLNVTGRFIWRSLKRGWSPEKIAKELENEFSVQHEQAQASVRKLIDELLEQQLLKTV